MGGINCYIMYREMWGGGEKEKEEKVEWEQIL